MSLVIGVVVETRRLIGGVLLTSVLLGTYHRPSRRRLIVMSLDLANSTRLAEAMGELKVHDLLTRFFFDIDEPIADFGAAVHAYVGDEVIVSWPVVDDPARNARCLACFFAIERKITSVQELARHFGGVQHLDHARPMVHQRAVRRLLRRVSPAECRAVSFRNFAESASSPRCRAASSPT